MNATGVAHRRGYAIIVLLAAIGVAAWLVHARLDHRGTYGPATKRLGAPKPAAAQSETPPANAPAYGNGGDYGAPASSAPAAPAAPAPVGFQASGIVGTTSPKMGRLVTDNKKWTLYRFDGDTKGAQTSGCEGACAVKWPPILADDASKLAITGVDKKLVTLLPRADGSRQVAINGWRVYRFAADGGPARWKGQGRDGKWFVIQPTGAKNLSCVPSKPPSAPAG
jgi:predicted lipoprotein with Yx(FWY)xxD motif